MDRSERGKRKANKRLKGWFGKFMVVAVVILNIWFTNRIFDIVEKGGQEPMATVGAWFAFTTGELLVLGKIKTMKKRADHQEEAE